MNTKYVVGLGEALWDVLPEGKKLGGAPANFAFHAGQFGLNSIAVSALGEDKLADETIEQLEEKKLQYCMPRVPYPTGTVQVTLDDEGIPTYDIKENVAWDNIPFNDEVKAVAENTRAVCWGSLAQRNVVSRESIYKFLDSTPKVEVADTVGAGDSFTGTFCASILAGMPVTDAHKRAVHVSAYVCTQNGAMPILPEEVKNV